MPKQLTDEDHGKASEWPFTYFCDSCGYVGWPNSTEIRESGKTVSVRESCPRSQDHPEMIRIRIDTFSLAPGR